MRVLICGGRKYTDRGKILYTLRRYNATVVIHGAAKGADMLADDCAKELGLEIEAYPANWKRHGRAAGPIRNKVMLKKSQPDLIIAFPTLGSKGTWDMVRKAQKAGVEVILCS